jgi:hypothetical protein
MYLEHGWISVGRFFTTYSTATGNMTGIEYMVSGSWNSHTKELFRDVLVSFTMPSSGRMNLEDKEINTGFRSFYYLFSQPTPSHIFSISCYAPQVPKEIFPSHFFHNTRETFLSKHVALSSPIRQLFPLLQPLPDLCKGSQINHIHSPQK